MKNNCFTLSDTAPYSTEVKQKISFYEDRLGKCFLLDNQKGALTGVKAGEDPSSVYLIMFVPVSFRTFHHLS